VETPYGPCFISTISMDLGEFHGYRRLREFLSVDGESIACITGDQKLINLKPEKCLLLDTETTGLAGGTGSYAFLIGLGYIEERRFVTSQIFMRDYSEEGAALHVLATLASRFENLITFNGKTFDVGLLATRFTINRMRDPISSFPHLDLLHPCRGIYRHRLPDCRLSTLESQILGIKRLNDISGEEIPPLYFRYVRERDANLVKRIFEHNRFDVISLVSLAAQLYALLKISPDCDAAPADLLGLGLLISNHGNIERAINILELALRTSDDVLIRNSARHNLIIAHKRRERYEDAAGLCQNWLKEDPEPFDAVPYEELAKHMEHRLHDFREALLFTEEALKHCSDLITREALEHRRFRLIRRLENNSDLHVE